MRRLLCLLSGHKPELRTIAGPRALHYWTRCRRCTRILETPASTARPNRHARRQAGHRGPR